MRTLDQWSSSKPTTDPAKLEPPAVLLPSTTSETRPGEPVFRCQLRENWSAEVFDQLQAIEAPLWKSLYPTGWKDDRYFRTLEETFAGEFAQFYLVLRDGAGRARALQPFFLVDQDLTVSLHPQLRTLLKPLRRVLRAQLLMVGCIVGDGKIGVQELRRVPEVCAPLDDALTLFAKHRKVRFILFKDFPAAYRSALATMTQDRRYTRLPSLPAVKLDLNFASFDEYVQTRLGKSTRKSLRRKFREIDELADPVRLEVKSCVTREEAVVLHALYERVARQGQAQFEVLTAGYFYELGRRMPDQARFFIWRYDGQIVAFSFCMVHADTLYDNDLGTEQAYAIPLHLYHVTFRDIVRWALAQGLRFYQSSPFNYEPKLRLQMELVPLDLYARHTSVLVNKLLRWFAPLAAPTRQEALLGQFPNVDAL